HRTRLDRNLDIHLNQSLPSSKSFRVPSASLYVRMDLIQALKDATDAGIVKGLKDISGVKHRLDIDVMIRDQPDTFNLFILALDKMQKPDFQPRGLRYAEISGIHGIPMKLWDGVPGKVNMAGGDLAGIVITPGPRSQSGIGLTLHHLLTRYLQQTLFITMVELARQWNTTENREKYHQAALEFRMPYWDYYRPRGPRVNFPGIIKNGMTSFAYDYSCPIAFTVDKINVRAAPDDKWMAMGNPLHHWDFEKDFVPEKDWVSTKAFVQDELLYARNRTTRYPLPGKGKTPSPTTESETLLNQVLNALRMDSNRLAQAFLLDEAYNEYDVFASNESRKEGYTSNTDAGRYMDEKASGSLESLHNLYHGLIGGNPKIKRGDNDEIIVGGGGGHMSQMSTAAFDPVFWMHHGQVERLASIWQAIHRDEEHSWLKEASDRELALFPFRQSPGIAAENMWKADMLRDHETLGYTRRDCEVKAPANSESPILQPPLRFKADSHFLHTTVEPIAVDKTPFFAPLIEEPPILSGQAPGDKLLSGEEKPGPGKHLAVFHPKHNSREWYIDNMVTRQFFNGTFSVFFFIFTEEHGAAPDTTHDAFQAPALVGVHHVFTAPAEVCDNCGDHAAAATLVETTIPITSMLIDFRAQQVIRSLEPEDVKPFLTKRLKCKICTADGMPSDPRAMAGDATFKVGISTKCIEDGQVSYARYADIIDSIVGSAPATCSAVAALGDRSRKATPRGKGGLQTTLLLAENTAFTCLAVCRAGPVRGRVPRGRRIAATGRSASAERGLAASVAMGRGGAAPAPQGTSGA
ncbi:Tyrosinase, partial [Apiospora phragmitis]